MCYKYNFFFSKTAFTIWTRAQPINKMTWRNIEMPHFTYSSKQTNPLIILYLLILLVKCILWIYKFNFLSSQNVRLPKKGMHWFCWSIWSQYRIIRITKMSMIFRTDLTFILYFSHPTKVKWTSCLHSLS